MLIRDCRVEMKVVAKPNDRYSITSGGWIGIITKIEGDAPFIWVIDEDRLQGPYEHEEYGFCVLPEYFEPYTGETEAKVPTEPVDVSEIISEDERNYLLDSMRKLLSEYDYQFTDTGLNKIIDIWALNKANLITAFKKHPNYKEGKFLITFERSYERFTDANVINYFEYWCLKNAEYIRDYLPEEVVAKKEKSTLRLPWKIYHFIEDLHRKTNQFLSEEDEHILKEVVPAIHPHAGQKMSRVINKLLRYLGYDKIDGYEREFAKYADALNPITVKQTVVLSLNPLDYFTMSFGNSWSSCHTIDKENKRSMPNSYEGVYSSGTMSYMLDETSMVLYSIDQKYKGNEYWDTPKVNRQMFHYGEDKLIQSRLYPQSNDVDSSAYEPFRNIVQEIISTIFEFPNYWKRKKGTDAIYRYVSSDGTHYRDYSNFEACSICWPTHKEMNEEVMLIGHDPICIKCGKEHAICGNISCCPKIYYCTECGKEIANGHVLWVDDKPYCDEHAYWCNECDEYHVGRPFVNIHGCTYCDKVKDDVLECPVCGRMEWKHGLSANPETGELICDACFRKSFVYCNCCNEPKRREDVVDPDAWFVICKECDARRV